MIHPLALVHEIELIKSWEADVKKVEILSQLSPFHKIYYIQRGMPFPMSDRDFIVCQTTLVDKERKGAMVLLRSAEDER
jgi:hypothetical protein